jgi:transposase
MGRFVEGEDRKQPALLPSCLEDYVTEENPARVIDVFVDELQGGGSSNTPSGRSKAGWATRTC